MNATSLPFGDTAMSVAPLLKVRLSTSFSTRSVTISTFTFDGCAPSRMVYISPS